MIFILFSKIHKPDSLLSENFRHAELIKYLKDISYYRINLYKNVIISEIDKSME